MGELDSTFMFRTHLAFGVVAVAVPKPLGVKHVDEAPGLVLFSRYGEALGVDIGCLQRGVLGIKLEVIAFEHGSKPAQIHTVRADCMSHQGGVPGAHVNDGHLVVLMELKNGLPTKQLSPQV